MLATGNQNDCSIYPSSIEINVPQNIEIWTYKAVFLKLNLQKNYYDLQTGHNDNATDIS